MTERKPDANPEDDPDYNPMYPPGEDPKDEDTDGAPMKSIADDVEGDEPTEDMTDVEAGDA